MKRLGTKLLLGILALGLIVAGIGLIFLLPHREFLMVQARAFIELVQDWLLQTNPVLYFSALVFLPLAGFPLSPFYLTAGAFGAAIGITGTIIGVSLNMALAYWLGATILHPLVERVVKRMGYRIPKVRPENEVSVAFLIRVCGMPFPLQNYSLALSGIGFWKYMAVSVPVQSVFAVAIILVGDSIFDGNFRYAIYGVSLLIIVIVGTKLLRNYLTRKKELQEDADPSLAASDSDPA